MCHEAMKKGDSPMHMLEHLITPEMCLKTVEDDGNDLELVPERLRTEKLCLIAMQSADFFEPDDFIDDFVPKEIRNKVRKLFNKGVDPYTLDY